MLWTYIIQKKLTFAMASAMDSTIPPTMPTSLAASLSVTMMSSTASFMSWAASAMASWVWDACQVWAEAGKYPHCFFADSKLV